MPKQVTDQDFIIVEAWNPGEKAKFPEHLKPRLKRVGRAAFEHDMFGTREDSRGLYQALTSALPYNQFTLTVCRAPSYIGSC